MDTKDKDTFISSCRLCGKQNLTMLLDLGKHPIAHHFLDSPLLEEYVHPVTLYFCQACGLVQLIDPVPPHLLYTNYVCLSSWKHQPHVPRLIQIIKEYAGVETAAMVLEVGSNDGCFLKAMQGQGYNNLLGIEPAKDACQSAHQKGIKTVSSFFNMEAAKRFIAEYSKCDLFISRQMLEHIQDLEEFRKAISTVLSPNGFVMFEIPDFACFLDTSDYSIWEEHVNYFTIQTLTHFLSTIGIEVIYSEKILFSSESLVVVGKYVGDSVLDKQPEYRDDLRKKVFRYRDNWPVFRNAFIEYLRCHKKKGDKIAIYGAGVRLCSLINFIGFGPYIEFIVDDQPEKQGKYMPGSKLPILPSTALEEHFIDLCLLAVNSECEDKVIAKHPDFIKRGGSFFSVLPPSDNLPYFWNNFNASKDEVLAVE